jgi:hypothetical protein
MMSDEHGSASLFPDSFKRFDEARRVLGQAFSSPPLNRDAGSMTISFKFSIRRAVRTSRSTYFVTDISRAPEDTRVIMLSSATIDLI